MSERDVKQEGTVAPGQSFLTLEAVAERLGMHYQFIYRLARSGELPTVKLGRMYRVDEADLQAFLEARKRRGPLAGSKDASGETCPVCGRAYRSRTSFANDCEVCGQPICVDCWERRKLRRCPNHQRNDGTQPAAGGDEPPTGASG